MLYKYYSVNDYSKDSLQKQYFWFSKPTEFNDPFDCNMDILTNYPLFNKKLDEISPEIKTGFRDAAKHFGICCFSEENNNMHLWSLYANSYKGFVLEFDESTFEDHFSKLFAAKCNLQPANYRDFLLDLDNGSIRIPVVEPNGEQNGYIDKPINDLLSDPKKLDTLLEYLICQKNKKVWSIEKEKRVIISNLARNNKAKQFESKLGYSVPWPTNSLRSIIFGHRLPAEEKKQLSEIIHSINPSIPKFETKLDFSNWEISIIPFNSE